MTAVMEHPEQRPTQPPHRPAWTLTADQTLTELDRLHDTLTRLSTRRLELLHHLDTLGHARALGARDTTELISLRHRLDPQSVRRDLRTASALVNCPTVAAQLPGFPTQGADAGDDQTANSYAASDPADADDPATVQDAVTVLVDRRRAARASDVRLNPVQAAVITEALAKVPTHVRPADVAIAETELVIAARTLLPRDLRRLGRAMLDRLDTDGSAPSDDGKPTEESAADAAHAAQTLWFVPSTATTPNGSAGLVKGLRFGGFLTAENAELFQTLIDAAAKPRKTSEGELDPRTVGQRRADALTTVLRAAASTGGEIPAHGGIKPHLSVTIPYGALAANLGSDTIAGPANGVGTRFGASSLVFGDPLPINEVRRIACDAGIIPIVLGARSEPLDVGREQRLVTPAIRRALIARDGGCVIPGCGAPPGHCDAHHLIHWADGGITAVSNLALVCPTHHRAIHHGIWTVTIVDGQVHLTRPDWTEPGPSG